MRKMRKKMRVLPTTTVQSNRRIGDRSLPSQKHSLKRSHTSHSILNPPPTWSQYPSDPEKNSVVGQDSTCSAREHRTKDALGLPVQSESGNSLPALNVLTAEDMSLPSCSSSSLSHITFVENKTCTGAETLVRTSSEEFTPDDTDSTDSVGVRSKRHKKDDLSPVYSTMSPRCYKPGRSKRHKKDDLSPVYSTKSPSYILDQPPPGARAKTGMTTTDFPRSPLIKSTCSPDLVHFDSEIMSDSGWSSMTSSTPPLSSTNSQEHMLLERHKKDYLSTASTICSSDSEHFISPGGSSRQSSTFTLSQTSEENMTFRAAESSPDMLLKTTREEFTPDMAADGNDESYRFQCSFPGLYQCSLTGLVFHMEGEGDVVYRTVPWDRRLLAQHEKKPAGPLFDIKCVQQSMCRLHLPHCEIVSTDRCASLSVAHLNDDGVDFISPHEVTESHVIINITGFSGYGIARDEVSPPDPVKALVLLFYRPPDDADPDPECLLNVLLLQRNVVLPEVLRFRKKLDECESYIETSPHCKLLPNQEYSLSTVPEDHAVRVQPTLAEFDCENYDNFFPSFQVTWETPLKHIKLILRDISSTNSVWERRVRLSVSRSRVGSALNLPPEDRLTSIRSRFIERISGPVLKSLLDELFDKRVMTDSERESAEEMQKKRDKARCVIDTVRRKGEAASSVMIKFLCEADPYLCEHLGLI